MFADVYRITAGGRRLDQPHSTTRDYKSLDGLLRAVKRELQNGVVILHLFHDRRLKFRGPVSIRRVLLRAGEVVTIH